MFENRKSLIQHCERSELRIHFRDNIGQTVLPDKSISIEQKLLENAKIKQKINATFFGNFQTLC